MLHADKQQLERELAQSLVDIEWKELDYLQMNMRNLATSSAVLVGFGFFRAGTGLDLDELCEQPPGRTSSALLQRRISSALTDATVAARPQMARRRTFLRGVTRTSSTTAGASLHSLWRA